MKKMKSVLFVAFVMFFLLMGNVKTVEASSAVVASIPLSNGGRVDIHKPHENKYGQYHGHEYNRSGKEVGSENLDGSIHDGGDGFSEKTKEELEDNDTWNKYKDRNTGTEGYKNKHPEESQNSSTLSTALGIGVAVLLVAAVLSPIPGDEALAAGLLLAI